MLAQLERSDGRRSAAAAVVVKAVDAVDYSRCDVESGPPPNYSSDGGAKGRRCTGFHDSDPVPPAENAVAGKRDRAVSSAPRFDAFRGSVAGGGGGGGSAGTFLKDQIVSFFQVSDNKLALKLFGNKNALQKEKLRQRAAGNWVIHPCSNFR